jgi:hypothetical protein
VKRSGYLSVAYVSLSSSGLLNKNLFCSVITFLDCFVAMLLAMTGRLTTLLHGYLSSVIASCRPMLFAVMGGFDTLLCVVASCRLTLLTMTEKLNTLLHDYLSSVIARSVSDEAIQLLKCYSPRVAARCEDIFALCDYSSSVVASEQKGVKRSSYLSVVYVSLSSSGLLNRIIFFV